MVDAVRWRHDFCAGRCVAIEDVLEDDDEEFEEPGRALLFKIGRERLFKGSECERQWVFCFKAEGRGGGRISEREGDGESWIAWPIGREAAVMSIGLGRGRRWIHCWGYHAETPAAGSVSVDMVADFLSQVS
jgi:hypothetical protein